MTSSRITIERADGSADDDALDHEFRAFAREIGTSPVPIEGGNVARVLLGALADGDDLSPVSALTRDALLLARVLRRVDDDDDLRREVGDALTARVEALEVFVQRLGPEGHEAREEVADAAE